MSDRKRTRHTASYQLSHFLNSKDSLDFPWVTSTLVSILRYMYDVMEMNYSRTNLCVCDKSIHQIAIYSRTSDKTVKRSLPVLVEKQLLSVEKRQPRTPTHFGIGNIISSRVTMTPELSTDDNARVTTTQGVGSPRPQKTPNMGHGDPYVRKACKKDGKKQRERAARTPLTLSWLPNDKNKAMAQEIAGKVGKTPDQLITKFRNLQISKDATSAYWDGEFENYLINERVPVMLNNGSAVVEPQRPKSRDWTAERIAREEAEAKNGKKVQEAQTPELEPVVEHVPYKEMLRRYRLKQQGALTNEETTTNDTSNNHSRGTGSG